MWLLLILYFLKIKDFCKPLNFYQIKVKFQYEYLTVLCLAILKFILAFYLGISDLCKSCKNSTLNSYMLFTLVTNGYILPYLYIPYVHIIYVSIHICVCMYRYIIYTS